MILTGQATREEALRDQQQPTYDEDLQAQDKAYVAKKLGWSDDEFEAGLSQPNRSHDEFGTDEKERRRLVDFLGAVNRMTGRRRV